MARSFNGSTDRIDYANVANPSGQPFSFACWMRIPTNDQEARFLTINNSADSGSGIFISIVAFGSLELIRLTSGSRVRRLTSETIAAGLTHIVVTALGNLTGSDMHMYEDGVEMAYNTTENGSGTENAHTGLWSIGGRSPADDRNLDGEEMECGFWNRVLDPLEITALAKRFSPRFFPRGLLWAPPLVRSVEDPISGNAPTLDGTTVVAHPPIIYPTQPVVGFAPAVLSQDTFEHALEYRIF